MLGRRAKTGTAKSFDPSRDQDEGSGVSPVTPGAIHQERSGLRGVSVVPARRLPPSAAPAETPRGARALPAWAGVATETSPVLGPGRISGEEATLETAPAAHALVALVSVAPDTSPQEAGGGGVATRRTRQRRVYTVAASLTLWPDRVCRPFLSPHAQDRGQLCVTGPGRRTVRGPSEPRDFEAGPPKR